MILIIWIVLILDSIDFRHWRWKRYEKMVHQQRIKQVSIYIFFLRVMLILQKWIALLFYNVFVVSKWRYLFNQSSPSAVKLVCVLICCIFLWIRFVFVFSYNLQSVFNFKWTNSFIFFIYIKDPWLQVESVLEVTFYRHQT